MATKTLPAKLSGLPTRITGLAKASLYWKFSKKSITSCKVACLLYSFYLNALEQFSAKISTGVNADKGIPKVLLLKQLDHSCLHAPLSTTPLRSAKAWCFIIGTPASTIRSI